MKNCKIIKILLINFNIWKPKKQWLNQSLKVVSATFLLVCFASLKEGTCEKTLHFVSSFCSRDNQIFNF